MTLFTITVNNTEIYGVFTATAHNMEVYDVVQYVNNVIF